MISTRKKEGEKGDSVSEQEEMLLVQEGDEKSL